jgi:hypothetical protein
VHAPLPLAKVSLPINIGMIKREGHFRQLVRKGLKTNIPGFIESKNIANNYEIGEI